MTISGDLQVYLKDKLKPEIDASEVVAHIIDWLGDGNVLDFLAKEGLSTYEFSAVLAALKRKLL